MSSPNLDFDPLFDPSIPTNEHPPRQVPQMPSSHKGNGESSLKKKQDEEAVSRNRSLYVINRIITVCGFCLCVLSVAYVLYYCVVYMNLPL